MREAKRVIIVVSLMAAAIVIAFAALLIFRSSGVTKTLGQAARLLAMDPAGTPAAEGGLAAGRGSTLETMPRETLDINLDRRVLDPKSYAIPQALHPRGLNIALVSEGFEKEEDFARAAQFVKDAFSWIEPWRSYKDFNFFEVFTGQADICHIEIQNHVKPTLRCNTRVNDYIAPLGLYRFKAVILSRRDFTAWANVTRLDNSVVAYSLPADKEGQEFYRKVLLHEFAHGFGLRDEMTKSVIALGGSAPTRAGGPNCAPDLATAKDWWGDLIKRSGGAYVFGSGEGDVGFYFGCAGHVDFIKPTIGSLMNMQDASHPSDDYGPVSERYLRKVLDYCFSEKVYSVRDDPDFFWIYPEFSPCVTQ